MACRDSGRADPPAGSRARPGGRLGITRPSPARAAATVYWDRLGQAARRFNGCELRVRRAVAVTVAAAALRLAAPAGPAGGPGRLAALRVVTALRRFHRAGSANP